MNRNHTPKRSVLKKTGIVACILALVLGLWGCSSFNYISGIDDPFEDYSTLALPDISSLSVIVYADDGTIINFGIICKNTVPLAYVADGIMDAHDTKKFVMTDDEFNHIRFLIKDCGVDKWDGFDKTDTSVPEGSGYKITFRLHYADDTTVSAYGHNTMPKGMDKMLDGIAWVLNDDSIEQRYIEVGTLHLSTFEGDWYTATRDMKMTVKDGMLIQSYLNSNTGEYTSVFGAPVEIESSGVLINLETGKRQMFDYDFIQFRQGLLYACYEGENGEDYDDIYAKEGQEGLLPITPIYANARKGVADDRITYFSLVLNHPASFQHIPLFEEYADDEEEDLLYINAKTIEVDGEDRLEVVINIYHNPKVVLLDKADTDLFREIMSSESILGYNQYNDIGDNDPEANTLFLDIRFASREIVEITSLDGRLIDEGLLDTIMSLISNGEPYYDATVNRRVPETWKCQCGSLNFAFFNVCNRCGRERPATE